MRFGYCLNHICFLRPFEGLQSVIHQLLGTIIAKFLHVKAGADNIMMFNITDFGDKWVGGPWWVPITGSNLLVTKLSMCTSCAMYCLLPAIYVNMDPFTSYRMLLHIIAASGFRYHF